MSNSIYDSRYQKPQVNSSLDPSQSNHYNPSSQGNPLGGSNYDDMMNGMDPNAILPGEGPVESPLTEGQQILVDKLHKTEEDMASKLQELESKYDSIRSASSSPDEILSEINELNKLISDLEGKESLYEQMQKTLNNQGIETVGFDMEKQIDSFEAAVKGLEGEVKEFKAEAEAEQKAAEEAARVEAEKQAEKEAAVASAEAALEEANQKEKAAEFAGKLVELGKSIDGSNGWIFAANVGPDGKHIYNHYEGITASVQDIMKKMSSAASSGDWGSVTSTINGLATENDHANLSLSMLFRVLKNDPDVFKSIPNDVLVAMTEKLGVDYNSHGGRDTVLGILGGMGGGALAGDPLLGALIGGIVGFLSGDRGIYSLPAGDYPPKDHRRRKNMSNERTTPRSVAEELLVMISDRQAAEAKAAAKAALDAAKDL